MTSDVKESAENWNVPDSAFGSDFFSKIIPYVGSEIGLAIVRKIDPRQETC